MELNKLQVKAGYVLVELNPSGSFLLAKDMFAGKVITGIKEIGLEVIFKEASQLKDSLYLVKVDDILAFIKPEEEIVDGEKKEAQS